MEQGHFQLHCHYTGVVKAFKRMTWQKAGSRNSQLASEESGCRWMPVTVIRLASNDPFLLNGGGTSPALEATFVPTKTFENSHTVVDVSAETCAPHAP